MGEIQTEHRQNGAALARKYLRFQEVGLSIWLAWPVAIMVASMYGLDRAVGVISVFMIVIGAIVFAIGHYGRQELRERKGGVK